MKQSLKEALHNAIRSKGRITLQEAHQIGFSMDKPKKASNVERCLRPSISPEVETLYNEKGYVTGYKWVGETTLKGPFYFEDKGDISPPKNISFVRIVEDSELRRKYPALYPEKKEESKQNSLF